MGTWFYWWLQIWCSFEHKRRYSSTNFTIFFLFICIQFLVLIILFFFFFLNVKTGCYMDIGHLFYDPPRDGPTLWEIGIPDRSAAEFYVPNPNPKYINKLYVNHPDKLVTLLAVNYTCQFWYILLKLSAWQNIQCRTIEIFSLGRTGQDFFLVILWANFNI